MRPLGLALVALSGLVGTACDDHQNGAATATSASASAAASAPAAPSASAAPAASAEPGKRDAASEDAMAAEDEHLASELRSEHRHHHAGFAGFVFLAIETIGASPEQEASIGKIDGELKANLKPLYEANAVVDNLLADGIAAGKIDKAKVDVAVAKAGGVAAQVHPAADAALDGIHKLLKPEQRQALADKVEANWTLWKEANAGEQAADSAKGDNAKAPGQLSHVAKELGLTPEQVAKIKATLDAEPTAKKPFDTAAADAHMKAFTTAFVTDAFEAKKLPAATDNVKVVSWGAERMARFYEALAPVLTPEQRTKAADQLHEHAREPLAEGKP